MNEVTLGANIEIRREYFHIPAKLYAGLCSIAGAAIALVPAFPVHPAILAAEVAAVVLGIFIFSSSRWRLDKGIITWFSLPVIGATFLRIWLESPAVQRELDSVGWQGLAQRLAEEYASFHGMEMLFHGDIMLFLLGLTFFVNIIAKTGILEDISISLLRIFEGHVLGTMLAISAFVALLSGVLDGVSMIGLTIRIFAVILLMAKLHNGEVVFAVMASTILTTVCGMWLAYGEPPNLIMKSNLSLPDGFFLKYAMPLAVASFIIVSLAMRKRFKGIAIPLSELDLLERHAPDIKFMQEVEKGEACDPGELLVSYAQRLGDKWEKVRRFYHEGHHPISAMMRAGVEEDIVREFIKEYLGPDFVESAIEYYTRRIDNHHHELKQEMPLLSLLADARFQRKVARTLGMLAFIPFIGGLYWHAQNHNIPLFIAPIAASLVAFLGVLPHRKLRKHITKEALHEYGDYVFLIPLFLSITALSSVGVFEGLQNLIANGADNFGKGIVALAQFFGLGALSAILDNNVVADFASRAIGPKDFVFATAQIAGYAVGGCLTHIGSAQSVVAFAYIVSYLDPDFTPFQWVKSAGKMCLTISIVLSAMLLIMAWLTQP